MNKITNLFILITILFSCQQKENNAQFSKEDVEKTCPQEASILAPIIDSVQTIDLNPYLDIQNFDFENIISEVCITKLETTTESIIGNIYKVIVTDCYIYVHDTYQGGSVIIFDRSGKYIKRLNHGQGPGELYHVLDMDYDYENDELCIYQQPSLFFYNAKGDFLRDLRMPLGFYNFKITDNGYIFKCIHNEGNYHLGDYHKYSLITTDKNLKIKNVALPIATNIDFIDYSYISDIRPDYLITAPFCDTIYDLQNENVLHAKYILKYDKKIERQIFEMGTDKLIKYIKENNSFYHLGAHIETNKYATFFIDSRKGRCAIYMNKENGKMIGGRIQQVNPKHIPFITFPLTTYNNYFVSVMEPYDYKQFEMEASDKLSAADIEKLNDYNSDDNPILVMYKIDNL